MGAALLNFEPVHLGGVLALCEAEGWPSLPADPDRALGAAERAERGHVVRAG